LNFTRNGIAYDQTTANTGALSFDASGNLTDISFGNNCGAGSCEVKGSTNEWFVDVASAPTGVFLYATP